MTTAVSAAPIQEMRESLAALVAPDALKAVGGHVGLILDAWRVPQARSHMYRMRIDLGPEIGMREVSSIITGLGPDEPDVVEQQLRGKRVIVGCRIAPRALPGGISNGMVFSGYLDSTTLTGSLPIFVDERLPVGSKVL